MTSCRDARRDRPSARSASLVSPHARRRDLALVDRGRPGGRVGARRARAGRRLPEERHGEAVPRAAASSDVTDAVLGELLARCSFPPAGTAVDCAFSGGADSTALIVLAARRRLLRSRPCTSTTACDRSRPPRPSGRRRWRRQRRCRLPRCVRLDARRRPEPRGPGPRRPPRRPAARRAHRAHRRRPGRDGADQPAARAPGSTGCAAMGPAPDPAAARPAPGRDRGAVRATSASSPVDDPTNARPPLRPRPRPPRAAAADGRHRRPRRRRRCSPAPPTSLADDLALAEAGAAELDPTDARALAAAPPRAGPAGRAPLAGRRTATRPTRPPSAACSRSPAASHVACEIAGGRRVERHRQRLRIVAGGPVASPDGMETTGPG